LSRSSFTCAAVATAIAESPKLKMQSQELRGVS
jgi:hypothetical protein